jgi:hypothetical protein
MAITFNMGGQYPRSMKELDQIFQKDKVMHDIYAFGSQEAVNSISTSLVSPSKRILYDLISKYFGTDTNDDNGEFIMVNSITLAATSLVVIIRRKHASLLKEITNQKMPIGWKNKVANKGAVSISFTLGTRKLLFINCHLEAHD